jgi:polyisoprenoid-binding protein YceI
VNRLGAALAASILALPWTLRAEPVDYATTPTHTFVHFEVLHGGLSTRRGRFNRAEGRITLDRSARSGSIEFTVQTASLDSGEPALDTRLRETLDSTAHPSARFTSRELVFDGEALRSARGTLELRGKSLPLDIVAGHFNCYLNPLFRRQVCGGEFIAEVEPARWGVLLEPSLGWAPTLTLRIQVEAVRQ